MNRVNRLTKQPRDFQPQSDMASRQQWVEVVARTHLQLVRCPSNIVMENDRVVARRVA